MIFHLWFAKLIYLYASMNNGDAILNYVVFVNGVKFLTCTCFFLLPLYFGKLEIVKVMDRFATTMIIGALCNSYQVFNIQLCGNVRA